MVDDGCLSDEIFCQQEIAMDFAFLVLVCLLSAVCQSSLFKTASAGLIVKDKLIG